MSSIAPQQGSATGIAEPPRAAEPRHIPLDRVAAYFPDNIAASISTRSTDAHAIAVRGTHDQNIAILEIDMAQYRNTADGVKPSSLLVETGSRFQ